jgi:hypothetical protein
MESKDAHLEFNLLDRNYRNEIRAKMRGWLND